MCQKWRIIGRIAMAESITNDYEADNSIPTIVDKVAFRAVLGGMKRGAKKRKRRWEITDSQAHFLMQQNCYYCGCKPAQGVNRVAVYGYTYNGLDRIDNNIGYTINNLVACCGTCNKAKGKQTLVEFKEWISRIHKNFINRSNRVPTNRLENAIEWCISNKQKRESNTVL